MTSDRRRGVPGLDFGRDVGPGSKSRQDAKNQPGRECDPEREQQDRRVDGNLGRTRGETGSEGLEHVQRQGGDNEAGRASDQRQDSSLGHQLSREPPSSGSKRRPDRHLLHATHVSRKSKVHQVRAHDEKQSQRRTQQDPQRRPGLSGQLLLQRYGQGLEAPRLRVSFRILGVQPSGHGREVAFKPRETLVLPEFSEDSQPPGGASRSPSLAVPERARRDGHVDVVLVGVLRYRRQHSDDGVHTVVHLEFFAHDVRITAKTALPVVEAQKQDRVGLVRLVVRPEHATQQGTYTQQVEEVPRDDAGLDTLRLLAPDQIKGHRVILDYGLQQPALLPVVLDFERRETRVLDFDQRSGLPQVDDPIFALIRQRLQQHTVDHAEDRSVRSNPQRKRQDSHERETRTLHQRSHSVT